MKYPITALSLFLIVYSAFSQSQVKHGVFVEVGGNAYWYSLNYERQGSKGFVARVGVCYYSKVLIVPLTVGKVFGHKNHHLELSGGLDLVHNSLTGVLRPVKSQLIALTAFTGYRYQHPDRKFFARVGFTPIWTFYSTSKYDGAPERVFPWLGASVGFAF